MRFFDDLEARTAGERQALYATPQLVAGVAGRIPRAAYLAYLAQAFHHVRQTVPLLSLARDRMDAGRHRYRQALTDYIQEETGHEEWILDDIANAGGDAAAVRRSAPGEPVAAMVAFVRGYIEHSDPMGMFGMIYVLEGTSTALATHGASALSEALGLGPECFTYLSSHGTLDQQHMAFFAALMNTVQDPGDQAAIVAVAQEVCRLFAAMFSAIPLDDEAPGPAAGAHGGRPVDSIADAARPGPDVELAGARRQ